MATVYWLGTATAVAQVDTVQVTAYDAATTYTLTVGDQSVSVAGNASASQTATDLAGAWNAATHAYFTGITASAATDTVTLTADTAGVSFVASSGVASGNGTIGNVTSSTAVAGPNVWATDANWSDGTVPDSSDDVIIPAGSPAIAWLPSSTQTLLSLTVEEGAPRIGLDVERFATNADGTTYTTGVRDYRQAALQYSSARTDVGKRRGLERTWTSGRIMLDNRATSSPVVEVHTTPSSSADTGRPAVRLALAHPTAALLVRKTEAGGLGIAVDTPDATATVGNVTITADSTTTKVLAGAGTTLGNWTQRGGDCRIEGAAETVTAITASGGDLALEGDYTVTTLTVDGATVVDNHIVSSGNSVTTCVLRAGKLDLTQTGAARAYGTLTEQGGTLADDPSVTISTHTRARGEKVIEA